MKKTIVFAIMMLALTVSCDKPKKSIKNMERETLPSDSITVEEGIREWSI